MRHNTKSPLAGNIILVFFIIINVIVLREANISNERWYWLLILTLPLLLLAASITRPKKRARFRSFPVVACLFYFFNWIRPGIRRYFVEPDPDRQENEFINHYKTKKHEESK